MLQIKAPGNGCGCRRRRPPSSSLALLSLVNCGRCHTGTVRRGVRVGVGCYYLCPVISSGACAELKTGKSCGSRRRQWGSVPSHSSQLVNITASEWPRYRPSFPFSYSEVLQSMLGHPPNLSPHPAPNYISPKPEAYPKIRIILPTPVIKSEMERPRLMFGSRR